MKNLHIKDSYNVWDWVDMKQVIKNDCLHKYGSHNPKIALNRSYCSMYVEWWLHNIGYYLTMPFRHIKKFNQINLRCKDVDLEEWI